MSAITSIFGQSASPMGEAAMPPMPQATAQPVPQGAPQNPILEALRSQKRTPPDVWARLAQIIGGQQ